jgi:hypothetical protein
VGEHGQAAGWYNSAEMKSLPESGKKYAKFHTFAVEGVE